MKYIPSYKQFINEANTAPQLYFITLSNDISHVTTATGKKLNQQIDNYIINNIWDGYDFIQNYEPDEMDDFVNTIPEGSLIYSFKPEGMYKEADTPDRKKTHAFYEALQKRKDELHIFMDKNITASKVKSQELFGDFDFFPKAVFKEDEIDEIGWPVVAKPDFGHSGIGIQKFDSKKELDEFYKKNPDAKLDIFCEMVDFKREFRALFVNNTIAYIAERIPKIEKNIDIKTKDAKDAMQFVYIPQDIKKFKYKKIIEDISYDILEKVDLSVYSIDFFLTKKDKIKVIEVNSQTGLNPFAMISLYRTLYNEVFKQPVPDDKDNILTELGNIFLADDFKLYEKEIKSSFEPINYDSLKVNEKLKKEVTENYNKTEIA